MEKEIEAGTLVEVDEFFKGSGASSGLSHIRKNSSFEAVGYRYRIWL